MLLKKSNLPVLCLLGQYETLHFIFLNLLTINFINKAFSIQFISLFLCITYVYVYVYEHVSIYILIDRQTYSLSSDYI